MMEMQQKADNEKIEYIEKQIGYDFFEKNLLIQTFSTKSYAKEQKDLGKECASQEEFRTQGDALLKQFLIELLKKKGYKTPQQITEEKMRIENGENQATVFSSFNIPSEYFLMGNGEMMNRKLCAETFESLIYAIHQDISLCFGEGYADTEIKQFISKWFDLNIPDLSQ